MPTPPSRPLTRLLRYSRGHLTALLVACSQSVLNKLFDLAPPLLIGAAVDIVVERENSFLAAMGPKDVHTQLWLLAALTLAVWALESVFEYLYSRKWRGLAQRIEHELRMDAYRNVQRLDLEYFEDQSVGTLASILNDDVNQLERFLDNGANQILQLATTLLVVGTMFVVVVPELAWMTLLPMPVVIVGSIGFQRRLEPYYAAVRAHAGLLASELSNHLSGIATIKSFVAEERQTSQLSEASARYAEANDQAIRLSSAFVPLIRMVIVIGFAAMMVYGGEMALAGELNLGAYSVVVFMTQRLLWPLTALGTLLDQYQRAMASTGRVLDLLDAQPRIVSPSKPRSLGRARGDISLDRVHFHYGQPLDPQGQDSRVAVLHDLSVTIRAGETVAFVGATGAGKSTLIKLLLRLYDAQSGSIQVDGLPIRELRLEDLRRNIGLVSQEVFLFHGSVKENIAFGNFDASLEQVVEAAKVAEAHEFILALPQGYDTIVGERGQKLSGGQRQRVSIARAVLEAPPVLLLDEATSSVDNETEAAIQRSLERIAQGRTVVLVAHRLSTVRNADHIYVLEQGGIVEQGTHEELLAHGGQYASLWSVQTGERGAA